MMKSLSIVAVGLIALANVVSAHVPEDKILGAWQWPTSHLPVLDGDISEWEVLPEELWIEINEQDFGGDLGTTKEIDVSDMWFRVAISWHDETDRLYYVIDRFDDLWDRDGGGFGDSGNDDSIEIGVDADHSGDWYFTLDRGSARRRAHAAGRCPCADLPLSLASYRAGRLELVLDELVDLAR